jgi:acyl-CoA reductase-like NAD-dependent aldehyde dehydrogenase
VSTGDGVPVGSSLVEHPDIALVSLTGDVGTDMIIAANAAQTLKGSTISWKRSSAQRPGFVAAVREAIERREGE